MTKRRRDKHSTEFGLWLRDQSEIDSKIGYRATNLDFIWLFAPTDEWMLLEEKRHGAGLSQWQSQIFKRLDSWLRPDPKYRGFHLLRFREKGPEDSGDGIWLDNKQISRDELIAFLQFKRCELYRGIF